METLNICYEVKTKKEYCQQCNAYLAWFENDTCPHCDTEIGYNEYCTCTSSNTMDCEKCPENNKNF